MGRATGIDGGVRVITWRLPGLSILVARLRDLLRYSSGRGRGFRLVAPRLVDGEVEWREGVWGFGGGWKHLHVSSLFELGFAAAGHEQDLHAHPDSYEVYIFLGGGEMRYVDEGRRCLERITLEPGDVVIVPPRVYHQPAPREPGVYAVLVPPSREKKIYEGELEAC